MRINPEAHQAWHNLLQWAQNVKHTEPQTLVGGITYRRRNAAVVFDIPLRPIKNLDLEVKVELGLGDIGVVFCPIRRCDEFYHNQELLKSVLCDTTIDELVVNRPSVSFKFTRNYYSPDFQFHPTVGVCVELNFHDNEFLVYSYLQEDDWNFEMFGTRLWKAVQERGLG